MTEHIFNFILEDYTNLRNTINDKQDYFDHEGIGTKEDFITMINRLDQGSKVISKEFEGQMTSLIDLTIDEDDIQTILKALTIAYHDTEEVLNARVLQQFARKIGEEFLH